MIRAIMTLIISMSALSAQVGRYELHRVIIPTYASVEAYSVEPFSLNIALSGLLEEKYSRNDTALVLLDTETGEMYRIEQQIYYDVNRLGVDINGGSAGGHYKKTGSKMKIEFGAENPQYEDSSRIEILVHRDIEEILIVALWGSSEDEVLKTLRVVFPRYNDLNDNDFLRVVLKGYPILREYINK